MTIWSRLLALRGVLALYIILTHCTVFWAEAGDIISRAIFVAFQGATAIGILVVFVFYLVSGLSIHARWAAKPGAPFSWRQYARRRARRILPPLFLALIVSGLIGAWLDVPNVDLTSFLGTFLFQQGIWTATFASNAPLWFLASDGYFYVAYPLFLVARVRFGRGATFGMLAVLAAALSVIPSDYATTLALYPTWLLGALLAEQVLGGERVRPLYLWGAACLFAGGIVFRGWVGNFADTAPAFWVLFSAGSYGPVAALLTMSISSVPAWLAVALRAVGRVSYPLFLVHYPIVQVVKHWIGPPTTFAQALGATTLSVTIALGVAAGVHFVTTPRR